MRDGGESWRLGEEERGRLLVELALDAGFDRAAVVALNQSERSEALRRWLARGDHAGMVWMERNVERRCDPRTLLAGAASALVVTLQYWRRGAPETETGDLWPRVARYARGEDYHEIAHRRLERVEEAIAERFPGARTRRYVDTGPILERDLAERADLGRVGKNTNLLHREGSWFLIAELLLDFAARAPGDGGLGGSLDRGESRSAPSGPEEQASTQAGWEALTDMCGQCTRCLEACPTGALPEPFRLDARRCISYWTIEHRGPFPDEVVPLLGDWVFGCDICQEVCPWNLPRGGGRGEPTSTDIDASGSGNGGSADPERHAWSRLPEKRRELDLRALLQLERDEYVERFRRSPMKRAKLTGLRRNAAVALGNRGRPEALEPLLAALEDEDDTVRETVVQALGRLAEAGRLDSGSTAEARRRLVARRDRETVPSVRRQLERALERLVD